MGIARYFLLTAATWFHLPGWKVLGECKEMLLTTWLTNTLGHHQEIANQIRNYTMKVLSLKNRFLFQEDWIIWVSVSEIRVELKVMWNMYFLTHPDWSLSLEKLSGSWVNCGKDLPPLWGQPLGNPTAFDRAGKRSGAGLCGSCHGLCSWVWRWQAPGSRFSGWEGWIKSKHKSQATAGLMNKNQSLNTI